MYEAIHFLLPPLLLLVTRGECDCPYKHFTRKKLDTTGIRMISVDADPNRLQDADSSGMPSEIVILWNSE